MKPGGYDSLSQTEVILVVDILALDAVGGNDIGVKAYAAMVFTPHIGTKDKECRGLDINRLQILSAWYVGKLIVEWLALPPGESLYLLCREG
jgi:hypothetical protein